MGRWAGTVLSFLTHNENNCAVIVDKVYGQYRTASPLLFLARNTTAIVCDLPEQFSNKNTLTLDSPTTLCTMSQPHMGNSLLIFFLQK